MPDDEEDDEETTGFDVEAAKERLRKEDQEFDKKEYSRKIKEKHRVSLITLLFITYTFTISSLIAWLVLSNLRNGFIYHFYISALVLGLIYSVFQK